MTKCQTALLTNTIISNALFQLGQLKLLYSLSGSIKAIFTSDGIVVVRALTIKRKLKIGVITATESESEESERFHFLPIPLMIPALMIQ